MLLHPPGIPLDCAQHSRVGWGTQGTSTAPQMAPLLSCALGCRTALSQSQDILQHCSWRAQSSSQSIQSHPGGSDSSPGCGRAGSDPSPGATLLPLPCTPSPGLQWGVPAGDCMEPAHTYGCSFCTTASASHCCGDTNCHENSSWMSVTLFVKWKFWSLANSANRALSTSA